MFHDTTSVLNLGQDPIKTGKTVTTADPEECHRKALKICPFNPEHMVHSYQKHVLKCARSATNLKDMVKCPYNAGHIMRRKEFPEHILENCGDFLAAKQAAFQRDPNLKEYSIMAPVAVTRSFSELLERADFGHKPSTNETNVRKQKPMSNQISKNETLKKSSEYMEYIAKGSTPIYASSSDSDSTCQPDSDSDELVSEASSSDDDFTPNLTTRDAIQDRDIVKANNDHRNTDNQLQFMKNMKFNRLGKGAKVEKLEVESCTGIFTAVAKSNKEASALQNAFVQKYVPRGRGNPIHDPNLDAENRIHFNRNTKRAGSSHFDHVSMRTPSSLGFTKTTSVKSYSNGSVSTLSRSEGVAKISTTMSVISFCPSKSSKRSVPSTLMH